MTSRASDHPTNRLSDHLTTRLFDVVTLGETMLRFTPPGFKRLEQATVFEAEVGGSESNTAVALARLGLSAAWLSRLPANSLGQKVARTLAGQGVDVSHVAWSDPGPLARGAEGGERLGLYFVELAGSPRDGQVLYDRRDSAFSRMQPEHLPAELFQPGRVRLLHLTGITPALSPSAAATALAAMNAARESGSIISFDLNYRARLWTPEAARAGCEPFASAADILIMPLRDAISIYDLDPSTSAEEALDQLRGTYPQAAIILTLGGDGALGCEPGGMPQQQPVFTAADIGRIGGGDAFAAGVLYGRLQSEAGHGWLAEALRWGAAMAALKYTIPGDLPIIDKAEVERLLAGEGSSSSVRR
jgi:2-dehydro-3-deoxygluconokinase